MDIHPIRSEADHARALELVARLWGAPEGSPGAEALEILGTLIDAYEAQHHAIPAPDPAAALRFRMEQQGLSRKDIEPMIGSRARVSEVLSGRRPFTLAMIRRLRAGLGISADVLIGGDERDVG